jgi:exonuclease SbcC
VTEAIRCVLAPEAFDELDRAVAAHDEAWAAARAVLDDPQVGSVAGLPVPDLERLTGDHRASAHRLSERQVAERSTRDRADRLAVLVLELAEALQQWAPVRAAHAVAAELASFVEGKSADNELRMRLSAFVLAWRLTQVVAAANERLGRMSDQRYTLEHTGRRGAGETRGGLSLLVRDEWSGEARDPATLSGGETFVVSLALALGLADVVTQEAGGADLDTLFVDEGFGALDADTLDDVMGTLDTLRDGGRVVGVVSHVPELRTRIPTRLSVAKGRSGSTITLERSVD